jgi:hypothetical protein
MLYLYGKQGLRPEQKSLARASPRALGEELFTESKKNSRRIQKLSELILCRELRKNSRRRILRREQDDRLSAKKFFAESFFSLGEEIFKKSLFHLHTFSIINMHLYKGYVQI